MILNKCLDERFVALLEPSGKLGFVIPTIREKWYRFFPSQMYIELCAGNILRVATFQEELIAQQYNAGQVAVRSPWLPDLAAVGWTSIAVETELHRFCNLWQKDAWCSKRIERHLRNQGRLGRIGGYPDSYFQSRIGDLPWRPGDPFVPVNSDRNSQLISALSDNRVLVLLKHIGGWDGIEQSMLEANILRTHVHEGNSTIAINVVRLARQKIRLGLLPADAGNLIPANVERLEVGVLAVGINPRSPQRRELMDRMDRYPEILMPVYGWNVKWSDPLKLLIPGTPINAHSLKPQSA